MKKDVSLAILQKCMDYVDGLDQAGIEKMKAIYEEEKQLSHTSDDCIQLILPEEMEFSLISQPKLDNYEIVPDKYGIEYTNQHFSEAKTGKNEYIAA